MSIRLVSLISTRTVLELSTSAVYPPIPTRVFDWSAIDSNTYDVTGYDGETGIGYSASANGQGASEAEAISDLFDQMESQQEGVL